MARQKKSPRPKSRVAAPIVTAAVSVPKWMKDHSPPDGRIPYWLRHNLLPRWFVEDVEKPLLNINLPVEGANALALSDLATMAVGAILSVRRAHANDPDTIPPSVFVDHVKVHLRLGRDELLKATPSRIFPEVSLRLDRMIQATSAALELLVSGPLNTIVCDSETCPSRGCHLLNGPWQDAMKKSQEAASDVQQLLSLFADEAHQIAVPPTAEVPSPMERPIPIAAAAKALNMRSDVLKKRLVARAYPIGGPPRGYVADLKHIVLAVPERKNALMAWATRTYPVNSIL